MSSRPGVEVTVQRPADGGEHPNRFIPFVSAHIRVFWPPLASEAEVALALAEATTEALKKIKEKRNA